MFGSSCCICQLADTCGANTSIDSTCYEGALLTLKKMSRELKRELGPLQHSSGMLP